MNSCELVLEANSDEQINFSSTYGKKAQIESEILAKLNSSGSTVFAQKLDANFDLKTSVSDYLQNGIDVHGSHPLFYWTRCRGEGVLVQSESAAVVLHYSLDLAKVVLMRPMGDAASIGALLTTLRNVLNEVLGGETVLLRYCSPILAGELRKSGWKSLPAPLFESAYADDETWPEVILESRPDEFPQGPRGRPVREAIFRHKGQYEYRAESEPLHCGELDFVLNGSFRSSFCDGYETDFNHAVVSFLKQGNCSNLTFHYLLRSSKLWGFGVTGNNTSIAHCYYSGVVKQARLTTYFFWQIYLNERKKGAQALNLGGSENHSLHQYKSKTFGDHALGITCILELGSASNK